MAFVPTRREALAGAFAIALVGCGSSATAARPREASDRARRLIAAARSQIGVTLSYDPAYSALRYPGGDVPRQRGVCTDVVIRAYRDAFGIDLQRLVHQDMAGAFDAYPRRWGLSRPDRNIDHRRVPNLEQFWSRSGARLTIPARESEWRAGDLFSSLVGGSLPHTGIVSDRLSASGGVMVIHNIGGGAREEELADAGRMIGRFRWLL